MKHRVLHSVEDLDLCEVGRLLDRARELEREADGGRPAELGSFVVGLLFLSPSLRTRLGFAVAAMRLGGSQVHVDEARMGWEMSAPESFRDTLRVVSGMVDVVVGRTPFTIERGEFEDALAAPYVNGGDGGGEHPTQALIDLFAIERFCGPLEELRVGLCGDLGGRAARSLIKLMCRKPPRSLVLMAPQGRDDPGVPIAPELARRTTGRHEPTFEGLDVLYMAGLPQGSGESCLDEEARAGFALTVERLQELPQEAIVLSPMPIVDEISQDAYGDPRIRVFDQGDAGVYVRMAILEAMLRGGAWK